MNKKEKLLLMRDVLNSHSKSFDKVSEGDINDYLECIKLFLDSDDPIIQEGSLATCGLIINKISTQKI